MSVCKNCGQTLNESSEFCTNCRSRGPKAKKNISSAPKTRIEKRKDRSKTIGRNKKLVTGIGSIMILLFILCVAYFMNRHLPKTNSAAIKTVNQSNKNTPKNNSISTNSNNSSANNSGESANRSSSDYIIPDSDKKVLSEGDISSLSKGQLRLARNEIYARHGYVFKSADLQTYFASKPWYHEDPSYDGTLNDAEKENVNLLKAREDHL